MHRWRSWKRFRIASRLVLDHLTLHEANAQGGFISITTGANKSGAGTGRARPRFKAGPEVVAHRVEAVKHEGDAGAREPLRESQATDEILDQLALARDVRGLPI